MLDLIPINAKHYRTFPATEIICVIYYVHCAFVQWIYLKHADGP